MKTNTSRFTFRAFFLALVTVNIIGVAIFSWLGTPSEQSFQPVSQTQVVMTGAIALMSIAALICLATAAYYARPKVQWQF